MVDENVPGILAARPAPGQTALQCRLASRAWGRDYRLDRERPECRLAGRRHLLRRPGIHPEGPAGREASGPGSASPGRRGEHGKGYLVLQSLREGVLPNTGI